MRQISNERGDIPGFDQRFGQGDILVIQMMPARVLAGTYLMLKECMRGHYATPGLQDAAPGELSQCERLRALPNPTPSGAPGERSAEPGASARTPSAVDRRKREVAEKIASALDADGRVDGRPLFLNIDHDLRFAQLFGESLIIATQLGQYILDRIALALGPRLCGFRAWTMLALRS